MSKGARDRASGTVISAGNPPTSGDTMRPRITTLVTVAALAIAAVVGSVSSASAASVRHFEGRVVSVDRSAKSFKPRESERGPVTVFVAQSTRFPRTSFAAVKAGRGIEVTVRRVDGRWQATKVEPRTGARQGEPGADQGGGRPPHRRAPLRPWHQHRRRPPRQRRRREPPLATPRRRARPARRGPARSL